ncbi:MAG: DUF6702 family protein [Pseudomonadota bacterium]
MMTRLLALILLLGGVVLPAQLSAHRGHQALTTITVDSRNDAVFVTHRLSAHDVEPVLANIAPDSAPSIDDPDSEAALLAYMQARFALEGVTLRYDGSDHRGDDLVYSYSGQLGNERGTLNIRSTMFFDQGIANSNRLLLRVDGKAQGLQTSPAEPSLSVAIGTESEQ